MRALNLLLLLWSIPTLFVLLSLVASRVPTVPPVQYCAYVADMFLDVSEKEATVVVDVAHDACHRVKFVGRA